MKEIRKLRNNEKLDGARKRETCWKPQNRALPTILCPAYRTCKVALTFFNFLVVTAPFQWCFQQPRVKISGVFWAQIENPLQR
jgi:hypothetical protein